MTLPVSEAFGPVWQGEGPHTGRLVSFLRLGLCNLHCEWCDTPYTWDQERFDVAAECPPWTARQVIDAIGPHGTDVLVLSGGEPLIHGNNPALHAVLGALPHAVHVETNGTLVPPPHLVARVAHWSVSPKIAQTADPEHRRIRPHALSWFATQPNAILKVVCRDAADVEALDHIIGSGAWGGWDWNDVWVMPEGTDRDTILARAVDLADAVAGAGFNLSLRQHTLMYGMERER